MAKMSSYKRFHKLQGRKITIEDNFVTKVSIFELSSSTYVIGLFISWNYVRNGFTIFVGVHLVVFCASNKPIYSHMS